MTVLDENIGCDVRVTVWIGLKRIARHMMNFCIANRDASRVAANDSVCVLLIRERSGQEVVYVHSIEQNPVCL